MVSENAPIPVLDRGTGMLYLQCAGRNQPLLRIGRDGMLYFLWRRGFKQEVAISLEEIESYRNIVRGVRPR